MSLRLHGWLFVGFTLWCGMSFADKKVPSLKDNQSCKSCHKAEYKEWSSSRHAKAGNNPVFAFEYGAHPGNWCLGCHAPRTTASAALHLKEDPALRQGVDCLTCHVKAGKLVSRKRAKDSPHQTVIQADFGNPKECAKCHQFNFPKLDEDGNLLAYTSAPMQNIYAEFEASGVQKNGVECISCHMNRGGHGFPGAYDPAQVRRALHMAVCQTYDEIQVTIENKLSAHNLPSGGVNRAIVLKLSDQGNASSNRQYRLERLFSGPVGNRKKHKDTTLAPGETALWRTPRSMLNREALTTLTLQAEFYLGTDPNRHRPTKQIAIDERRYKAAGLPACESAQ